MLNAILEKEKRNHLFRYKLSTIIKFLSITISVIYACSMLSLVDKSSSKNDCFANQKNIDTIKDQTICSNKSFTFNGNPISVIKWIN